MRTHSQDRDLKRACHIRIFSDLLPCAHQRIGHSRAAQKVLRSRTQGRHCVSGRVFRGHLPSGITVLVEADEPMRWLHGPFRSAVSQAQQMSRRGQTNRKESARIEAVGVRCSKLSSIARHCGHTSRTQCSIARITIKRLFARREVRLATTLLPGGNTVLIMAQTRTLSNGV